MVDTIDAKCILTRYSELVVGKNTNVVVVDEYESEKGEQSIFEFTDKMREKIDESGDVDADSIISATDAAYLLIAYYSNKEKGDVNTDGKLDARDASKMLSFYSANSVNIESDYVTEKNMEYLGDINGDGKTDAKDASDVLAIYAANSTQPSNDSKAVWNAVETHNNMTEISALYAPFEKEKLINDTDLVFNGTVLSINEFEVSG